MIAYVNVLKYSIFSLLFSAIGVQAFNKTTFYIVTWSDACVTTYPASNLAAKNNDAVALWHAMPMLVSTWNEEFMHEMIPFNTTKTLHTLLPMTSKDFRECVVQCNTLEEPRLGYFDTMLGDQRYGLYDAHYLMLICLNQNVTAPGSADVMMQDTSHLKVIINAPLDLNAGFYINSQIHVSYKIVPAKKPITKSGIRTWAGVLLHESLHGLGIGHSRAPSARSDMQGEYGMYGDIMGTWVDKGVGHTHFLNGAHLFALGVATPVTPVSDPVSLTFPLPVTAPTKPVNTSAIIAVVDTLEGKLVVDASVLNDDNNIVKFGLSGAILPRRVYIRVIAAPNPDIQRSYIPPVDLVAMFPVNSASATCVDLREWIAPSPEGMYVRGQPTTNDTGWTAVFKVHVCARLVEVDSVNITLLFGGMDAIPPQQQPQSPQSPQQPQQQPPSCPRVRCVCVPQLIVDA